MLCSECHNMKYSFELVTIALLLPTVKWGQNEQNTLQGDTQSTGKQSARQELTKGEISRQIFMLIK